MYIHTGEENRRSYKIYCCLSDEYSKCLLDGSITHLEVIKTLINVPVFLTNTLRLLEYIVLIPLQRTSLMNVVSIERRIIADTTDENILHVGGGTNVDFIIYKNSTLSKFIKRFKLNASLLMISRSRK